MAATKKPAKDKKIVPMLMYQEDTANIDFILERYGKGVSIAALTRTLYRKEAERLRNGGSAFPVEGMEESK